MVERRCWIVVHNLKPTASTQLNGLWHLLARHAPTRIFSRFFLFASNAADIVGVSSSFIPKIDHFSCSAR